MGGMKKAFAGVAIAMMLIGISIPMGMAATGVDCPSVIRNLAPCLGYLGTNGMGTPTGQCCGGVKRLAGMANTSPARRQICNCLKPQLNSGVKVTDAAVTNLPGKCNAGLHFTIRKNMNCNAL